MQDNHQFPKPGISATIVSWPALSSQEPFVEEVRASLKPAVVPDKVTLAADQVTWPEIKSENSK